MTTATSSVSGLVSGLDTATLISQLMAIEKKPLEKLQEQQDTANQQKTAFTDINTSLLALKTAMDELARSDTWASKTASVSNEDVLSASVTSATPAGNYTFKVTQLAAASQFASNGYADEDTALVGEGSFDLTVGDTTETITVDASDTLDDVAAAINAKDMGVSAVVVNTGQASNPYRLVLTSTETGAANAASISNNTSGLSFTELTQAKNAIIEFGADSPMQMESATNSVSGLAPGLTLDLKSTSASPVTVSVASDSSGLLQYAQDFVTKYNNVIDKLKTYDSYDVDNEEASVLFGNSTLRNLESDLGYAVSTIVAGQPAETNSLVMVGFSLGTDGKLALDESTFSAALDAHPEDIATLFSGVTNRALASQGGSITGPTAGQGSLSALIDGSSDGDGFTSANTITEDGGTHTFQISFGSSSLIKQLSLATVAGNGIKDFTLQLLSNGSWQTVKTVAGFTGTDYTYLLSNPMSATAMRLNVTAANGDDYTRLSEIKATEQSGVATRVSNMLSFVTDTVDGSIAGEESSLDTKINDLQESIDDMQERLDAKEERLQKEFTNMEIALAKLQSQSSFLSQLSSSSD